MLRPPERAPPVRIALWVADPALQAMIADACAVAGILVERNGSAGDVDVVLADHSVVCTVPVIAVATNVEGWQGDLRAIVEADIAPATLAAVIAVVAAGFTVMPFRESGRTTAAGSWAEPPDQTDDDKVPIELTRRESEVLALLAAGAANKTIARALGISTHTAKFHVAALTEKLGASSRLEAVAIAIRSGLVMA
jgi:DNA-binding CsgD family transcriptional regulator